VPCSCAGTAVRQAAVTRVSARRRDDRDASSRVREPASPR
jgi:hypothetical protein